MRLVVISFVSLLFLSFFTSCEDDIKLENAGETVPILYCILNPSDSVHYVKLNKSIDGTANAIESATVAENSYYANADIKVEEIINGQIVRTFNLNDTLISNKEEGAFFYPNQKLYYFKTPVNNLSTASNVTYRIKANINNGEFTISGETQLVSGVSVVTPTVVSKLAFVKLFNTTQEFASVSLKMDNGTAQIIDARLKVNFIEYFGTTPVKKSFEWKVGSLSGNQIEGTTSSFNANGKLFYELIAQNCTNDPAITKRQLESIETIYTGGAADLNKYISLTKPSSSLAQNKPTFTNLKTSDGRQVIGIFSARTSASIKKQFFISGTPSIRCINELSTKELCVGSITGGKLFCSQHSADLAESWFCN